MAICIALAEVTASYFQLTVVDVLAVVVNSDDKKVLVFLICSFIASYFVRAE